MSPAMVDFRSPASSSSSKVQSNLHGSQSIITGGIPSPSSHHNFGSSGIHDPTLSMNRSNLGQGASASKEKLSVPRFRKHRKRSGTSREMPATIASDSGAGLGFGPSKSEMLYAAPFDHGDDSGTQFLREQLYGWKPFVQDASNYSSSGTGFMFSAGSSGSNASSSNIGVGSVKGGTAFDICNGGSSDIGKGVFVFGTGMGKVSSWFSSSLQTSSGQNLDCANSAKSVSVETGVPAGGSDCSIGGGNVFSDKDAFVFGSKGKNDGNFCHSSSLGSDNDSSYKLNSSKNVKEKSRMPHSGFFVHRNGEKKSTHSSKDFSFASDDGLFIEIPDRSRKNDQENSVNVDHQKANTNAYLFGGFVETKFNIDQTSTLCSNGSSFSSVSKLPEDLSKLKIETSENGEDGNKDQGVFVFGGGVNKSSCSSKSSSFESFDSSFSKLPQKMEKLNLQSSVGVHGDTETGTESNLKKHAQLSQTFSAGHDVGGFSTFPGELKKQNLQSSSNGEHWNDNHGVFVFGSYVSKNVNSGKSTTLSFDESSISKLPQKMEKLNLQDSVGRVHGDSETGNESSLKKPTQSSQTFSSGHDVGVCSMFSGDLKKQNLQGSGNEEHGNDNHGVFVFGSYVSKNANAGKSTALSFDESSISKLPQKMEKLNLQSSVGRVNGDSETGNESSLKKPAQSSQTFSSGHDVGVGSMFSGDLKKQNLQGSGSEEHGNDNPVVFIFGSHVSKNVNSGESSTLSFDESSISELPDEIKNINLNSSGNEDDSLKSKAGNMWKHHDNNAASNFTSHSGKEDYDSRATPLQAHNSCGLSADTTSFPSPLPGFQTSVNHFCFTSMHTGSETPTMEFRSQKQAPCLLTKENVFTKPHKKMTSGMKKEDSKGVRTKNKKGKSRQSTPIHTSMDKQFVSVDKGPEENQGQDSAGGDSPMDYSPYQETLVSNQCPREVPFASAESIHFDSRCESIDAKKSGFVDTKEGEVFSATVHFHTNEILQDNEEADCCSRVPSARHFTSTDEMTSGLRKGSFEAVNENVESVIQAKSSSTESESFSYDSSIKQPTYEGGSEFTFNSCSQDVGQSNFLFAATSVTSSVQGPSTASKCNRRKSKPKGGQDSHRTLFLFPNAHAPTSPKHNQNGCDDGERAAKVNGTKQNQESAEEACEKWRLRGNQAYADGNLSKAEEYYSRGVDSLSLKEISRSCSRALMLCYSNRAATRMSLGRLREALGDCKIAVAIDPSFLRARVRAGNIHLSLGEPAVALQHFEKVLQLSKETNSDQKILLEAVDGLEKTKKLNDLINQSSTLLTKRTPDDATKVLEIISEAFSIAPYSEILLEMKAEALVKLRNFDEAIRICEQTLEFAEKNASITETACQSKETDCSKSMEANSSFWRWRVISKSYFYLGKLEEANELLQKHEKVKPVIDKFWNKYPESSTFPATVCELLHLKTAGNEAFQAGKHLEAVELYTAALALNTESRPFTAICFCNRAAAYQALGQIADAIADCSLAIALDSSYKRAISRRATLHEMIRDYGQAATDLQKLTSLLEMRSEDKNSTSGALGRSSSNITDLKQAQMRLCTVEEEARKGGTLDMYMILGIERSCSATDVRKAYRKAALRHHPDKASQFLARSENGDDRVWREVAEEVHSDADRLFKMIGEAYAILVDPSKRQQYDTEEELRTMKKGFGPRTPASSYSTQHERSSDWHRWRRSGSSYQR
ncbi:uncharacterized protein LOC110105734 [Dendrobium catenatum]|uniref:TPR repeat-containing thioredoxin TTL1 n=1 Tax=Dendrobium catenatum TaxID=906689 RepID=A0A2I0XDV7_9ASPA|nr:uncharacterized protein LOC110105734 [Dendrobium catenatum]PKU86080.1 TPR repeat-containing thioredoxin TTL1 [Dendrobium catenatum]